MSEVAPWPTPTPPIIYSFGRHLTLEDLPKPGQRWVPRRKAMAVAVVWRGLISAEALCARYEISLEEFMLWQRLVARHGLKGLRATKVAAYREDTVGPSLAARALEPDAEAEAVSASEACPAR